MSMTQCMESWQEKDHSQYETIKFRNVFSAPAISIAHQKERCQQLYGKCESDFERTVLNIRNEGSTVWISRPSQVHVREKGIYKYMAGQSLCIVNTNRRDIDITVSARHNRGALPFGHHQTASKITDAWPIDRKMVLLAFAYVRHEVLIGMNPIRVVRPMLLPTEGGRTKPISHIIPEWRDLRSLHRIYRS